MKHEFDTYDDTPKHCGNKHRFCVPHDVDHIVAYPDAFKGPLPWPDSLHVRVQPAACGCGCDDCIVLREMREETMTSAVLAAYKAYKRGEPVTSSSCSLCRMEKS